ncbi:hypothetical protein LguiA_002887 [Lonicera macranthoides]
MTLIPMFVLSKTLDSDIRALRSIKRAVDPISISPYSFLNTWDFNYDPCENLGPHFLGILCTIPLDNSSSQISMINLEGEGYDGLLTPAIGNLTELTLLNLSKNKFRGLIPNSITNLKKLTRLVLSDNFLSGNIPAKLNTLKRLESINMSKNRLSGSILAEFSSLRRLTLMSLSNNRFSGRIPNLTGLWKLRILDLSSNQLHGTLPKLPHSLVTLLLGQNGLYGHISPLMRLENLKTLDLSNNHLSGFIFLEILALPTLNHLNLSENRFTKIEVLNMTNIETQLKVLDAHANHLHGHLPVNLATYVNLTTLNLGQNLFSGQIPAKYGKKVGKPWRSMFLDHNFLKGDIPPRFNSSNVKVRGSFAGNCLNCPPSVRLCGGGQRAASECDRRSRGGS